MQAERGTSGPPDLPGAAPQSGGVPGAPLRLRGAVVGLALIAALAWLVPWLSFRIPRLTGSGSMVAWGQVPSGPFIMLVVVAWVLRPLLNLGRRRRWLPSDGLLAYSILLPAIIFASVGGLYYIFGLTATPFYPAGSPPRWAAQVLPYLPSWLLQDGGGQPRVIMEYYEGAPGAMLPQVPWGAWLPLLLRWGVFLMLYYYTLLALTGLFRRRWFREEHITFPLAELALTVGGVRSSWDPRGNLLKNKLLWLGFAIPFLHAGLIMAHGYVPTVPDLSFKQILPAAWPKGRPWDAVWPVVFFRWLVMGIAYVLPAQVSAGVLFFYFLNMAQTLVLASVGYASQGPGGSANTVGQNQGLGGALIFAIFFFWNGRHDRAKMWRDLTGLSRPPEGPPHPDRWALPGAAAGTVGLILWSHAAGLPWHTAGLFIVALLALQLCTARIAAALGMPHTTFGDGPSGLLR